MIQFLIILINFGGVLFTWFGYNQGYENESWWCSAVAVTFIALIDLSFVLNALDNTKRHLLDPPVHKDEIFARKPFFLRWVVGDLYQKGLSTSNLAFLNLALITVYIPGTVVQLDLFEDQGIVKAIQSSQGCQNQIQKLDLLHLPDDFFKIKACQPQFRHHVAATLFQVEILENLPALILTLMQKPQDEGEGSTLHTTQWVYHNLKEVGFHNDSDHKVFAVFLWIFKLLILGLIASFVLRGFQRYSQAQTLIDRVNREIRFFKVSSQHQHHQEELYVDVREDTEEDFKEALLHDPSLIKVLFNLLRHGSKRTGFGWWLYLGQSALSFFVLLGDRIFQKEVKLLQIQDETYAIVASIIGDPQLINLKYQETESILKEYIRTGVEHLLNDLTHQGQRMPLDRSQLKTLLNQETTSSISPLRSYSSYEWEEHEYLLLQQLYTCKSLLTPLHSYTASNEG